MKEKQERLLKLWKIRQEQEGIDVSSVKTLEEAEHFFDVKEEIEIPVIEEVSIEEVEAPVEEIKPKKKVGAKNGK